MALECRECQTSLLFLQGSGYFLPSNELICATCHQSNPSATQPLFDLLSDPIINHIRALVQGLYAAGIDSESSHFLYAKSLEALKMREQEMHAAYQAANPPISENTRIDAHGDAQAEPAKWQCPHCGHANLPDNIICYMCRNSPTEPRKEVPVIGELPMLLTIAERDSSRTWTCGKCQELVPFSQATCKCGYVNFCVVSSNVGPEAHGSPQTSDSNVQEGSSSVQAPVSPVLDVCWSCACGYEYNLKTSPCCLRCGKPLHPMDTAASAVQVAEVSDDVEMQPEEEEKSSERQPATSTKDTPATTKSKPLTPARKETEKVEEEKDKRRGVKCTTCGAGNRIDNTVCHICNAKMTAKRCRECSEKQEECTCAQKNSEQSDSSLPATSSKKPSRSACKKT